MSQVVFLPGKNIDLRPLTPADATGNYAQWFNDREVVHYMLNGSFPMSVKALAEFIDHSLTSKNDLILAISSKEGNRHIGNVGLHRIDWIRRSAEFGIVVGEKSYWGKGMATEATRMICDYGFTRLNLHRIWLGVHADHKAAIKSYENVGFTIEGKLRHDMFTDGKYADRLIMGLLRDELK